MTAKKERGLFSLRFNIGDPVQRAAVELLELQPPHSKAQYIANALVYYNTHFSDDPQPLKVPAIDRAAIEAIVREIMRQDEQASDKAVSTGESSHPKKSGIHRAAVKNIFFGSLQAPVKVHPTDMYYLGEGEFPQNHSRIKSC